MIQTRGPRPARGGPGGVVGSFVGGWRSGKAVRSGGAVRAMTRV